MDGNNDDMEELRASIAKKLEAARETVARLERAYNDLSPHKPIKSYGSGKYGGMLVWLAVRQYLKNAGPSTVSDIIEELEREGVDLGKYPRRTVKSSIGSHYLKGTFKVEKTHNDELVTLLHTEEDPDSESNVRQPKRKYPRTSH